MKKKKFYKFTFKKVGSNRPWLKNYIDVKLNKKIVGYISNGKIKFKIKKKRTEENPAPFKWVIIKRDFDSDELAKEWIRENNDKIQKQLDLHYYTD